jgi:hypothetical protein
MDSRHIAAIVEANFVTEGLRSVVGGLESMAPTAGMRRQPSGTA